MIRPLVSMRCACVPQCFARELSKLGRDGLDGAESELKTCEVTLADSDGASEGIDRRKIQ